ncbi:HDOD domain-containing protein [Frateuria sp. Soil773]|uniref:HDOD domain-containing protein n=1 Tax=Frateuria sp. Soil773 TaxID=1736407 RepID=UPI000ADB47F6|nr:HDOD domain-containing protein [Frateuria sp. Soil773]
MLRMADLPAAFAVPAEPPVPVEAVGDPAAVELIEDRFRRLVLGLPDSETAAASAAELATLRRLEAIGERFDVQSLPRLPTVLPQLLRSLKNDNLAGSQLAELVGRDPVLVGEVMRVTGSAHYRTAQPVHSLQQAVVLLGQEGLRRVATQHVMKPILQASAGMHGHMAGQHLWDHAERCAHASAYLGRNNGCDGFEAYLAGMVCHTGTGAVVRLLDQEAPPSLDYSMDFLRDCLRLGAQLSARAAVHWELPANVIRALDERAAGGDDALSQLGKALLVADVLAMRQLLAERASPLGNAEVSGHWPDCFAAPLVQRCQQDLRRHFGMGN